MKREFNSDNNICDLCGAAEYDFILTTPRLDGPLVCCRACHLFYVLAPAAQPIFPAPIHIIESAPVAAAEMKRLSERAQELSLVNPFVEENENKWRALTATERYQDLLRATSLSSGRLLEIGCATGDFLHAAHASFQVTGVEADETACAMTQARGFDCFHGTIFAANFPAESFDVVTLYHVIEHVPSPTRVLQEIHRVLRPKGIVVIETPNIETIWYRLLRERWRQFIPDHKFFFTPATLERSCAENSFITVERRSVGKAMSVRLFFDRLGRFHRPSGSLLTRLSAKLGWQEKTLQLNLGDVMRLYAQRK